MASNIDPLEVIFEKHFYESGSRSKEEFCDLVVKDYLNYLKYSGAIISNLYNAFSVGVI